MILDNSKERKVNRKGPQRAFLARLCENFASFAVKYPAFDELASSKC